MSEIKNNTELNTLKHNGIKEIKSDSGKNIDQAIAILNKLFRVDDSIGSDTKKGASLLDKKEEILQSDNKSDNENENGFFDRIKDKVAELIKTIDLQSEFKDYIADLKSKSECQDTINVKDIDTTKMEIKTSEEVKQLRDEFKDIKNDLIKQWEKVNNREWPKYTEEYIKEHNLKNKKSGDRYDAHHIVPLKLGGKNEVSNIAPLALNKHQEVHAKGGSGNELLKKVGDK